MNSIGFVELISIAKGYETADAALKTSDIEMIMCQAGCPGKFYFLFKGDTAAVKVAMESARATGSESIVDSTVISNVEEDVIKAMSMTTEIVLKGALGVLEFFSVTAAVYAADEAVKAANINLIEVRTGMGTGGKSYVTFTGSVAAVEAAAKAAVNDENVRGMLIHSTVIPNPDDALLKKMY